ncbi:MAG TPA: GNAT family N-acetyltransferase [Polyangiaceae bacterium]|nr:GNAT family N-acetyltransferase [Polyangiaceae bacterium]
MAGKLGLPPAAAHVSRQAGRRSTETLGNTGHRMTILVPMPPERFDEFAALAIASHAADNVASGRWLEHESEPLAEAEFRRLLPRQAATPDHHFYEIKVDPAGPVLGFVWIASMPRGSVRVVFVLQLFVYPEHRRQGHGRAALAQVEKLAEAMGVSAVALNVFASNSAARALYRSSGYVVTSLSLHKPLATRRERP